MNQGFQDGYEFFTQSAGAQLGAIEETARVNELRQEIEKLQSEIASLGTNKTIETLSGDIAEFYHAHTYNMEAILNGSKNRAYVPRSNEFASPDVILESGERFQIKYYSDGAKSAKAQAVSYAEAAKNPKTNTGATRKLVEDKLRETDPIYGNMQRLVPDDQLPEAEEYLSRRIAKESSTRPDQVERYLDTKENLTSTVSDNDGIASKKLSREESKQIAKEAKEGRLDLSDHGISPEKLMEAKHIAKASLKAGLSAAAIAALLQATPSILESVQELLKDGSVDLDRLQEDSLGVAGAGVSAFFAGAITAALTDMAQSGKLGEQFVGIPSSVIASATVIGINAFKNGLKVAKGEMDSRSYADSILRDTFVSSFALATGMFGQYACPIPAIGYMLGSFLGSAVGGIAYQAGKQAFISFSVESGATFFGLVDQDYELPESVLNEIGLDVFEYDQFYFDKPNLDIFNPGAPELGMNELESPVISFPRRGVIAIGKVGYIR